MVLWFYLADYFDTFDEGNYSATWYTSIFCSKILTLGSLGIGKFVTPKLLWMRILWVLFQKMMQGVDGFYGKSGSYIFFESGLGLASMLLQFWSK